MTEAEFQDLFSRTKSVAKALTARKTQKLSGETETAKKAPAVEEHVVSADVEIDGCEVSISVEWHQNLQYSHISARAYAKKSFRGDVEEVSSEARKLCTALHKELVDYFREDATPQLEAWAGRC